jgi:hypothetical protein
MAFSDSQADQIFLLARHEELIADDRWILTVVIRGRRRRVSSLLLWWATGGWRIPLPPSSNTGRDRTIANAGTFHDCGGFF